MYVLNFRRTIDEDEEKTHKRTLAIVTNGAIRYMPTYPLLCLAARYSERVYNRPTEPEKEAHIEANWRSGAKAMVLKSVPIDDMNTIILAIRGSQTFMDWTVNFRPAPSSPAGFLVSYLCACTYLLPFLPNYCLVSRNPEPFADIEHIGRPR